MNRWPEVKCFASAGGYNPRRPRLTLVRDVAPAATARTSIVFEKADRIYTHPREFRGCLRIERKDDPRGERRQALVLLTKALAAGLEDFDTARVGALHPERRSIQGIPVGPSYRLPDGTLSPSLMSWTGLSHDRLERAITDFSQANFQIVKTIVRTFKGEKVTYLCAPQPIEVVISPAGVVEHKAKPAIRVLTPTLWRALGMPMQAETWAREDANEKKRAEKKAEQERKERQQLEMSRLPAFDGHGPALPRGSRAPYKAPPQTDQEVNEAKRLAFHQVAVSKEFPDWPTESKQAEARSRLERETGPPDDDSAPF
jgi:hypothetical protein